MSVLRLQFEALIRAMWMLYVATDLAIQKLTASLTLENERIGNNLPQVSDMVIGIVKKAPIEASAMLVQFRTYHGLL